MQNLAVKLDEFAVQEERKQKPRSHGLFGSRVSRVIFSQRRRGSRLAARARASDGGDYEA
jgi:hypothetical protein